ncbi:MAG: phosphatidylglycerol lysyltransferase domain-containing protein [Treponema sp.]|nr:phosphatidylglycerol lysyltransferase domain-containing protein [Treponema sp.]
MSCPCWHEPSPDDAEKLFMAACSANLMGCTDSYANIILYRKKYRTQVCYCGGTVLRKYGALETTEKDISSTRTLYGFPIGAGDMRLAIQFLHKDASENGMPLAFPLLTAGQKLFLETKMPNEYTFTERRADSDYVYLTKSLAELPGGKYHKKKNHISQFMRRHPDVFYKPLTPENADDAFSVEETWFSENDGAGDYDKKAERDIIREALMMLDELNLTGGILYADNKPIAMTIGSAITEKVADVHFEKAVSEYDRDGAYAVINQEFAKTLTKYEYINREEDMGIEGLRKAKLSYHPDLLLAKWSAE